jgi:hypothetical protein
MKAGIKFVSLQLVVPLAFEHKHAAFCVHCKDGTRHSDPVLQPWLLLS